MVNLLISLPSGKKKRKWGGGASGTPCICLLKNKEKIYVENTSRAERDISIAMLPAPEPTKP